MRSQRNQLLQVGQGLGGRDREGGRDRGRGRDRNEDEEEEVIFEKSEKPAVTCRSGEGRGLGQGRVSRQQEYSSHQNYLKFYISTILMLNYKA